MTIIKSLTAAVLAASAFAGAAGSAQAQDWGRGYDRGQDQGYGRDWDGGNRNGGGWNGSRGRIGFVCSGRRAQVLEARLRREVYEGDIRGWRAERIHGAIDDLERRQRNECGEGDWRSVDRIADRYDRIEGWIAAEARGRDWRGGW